MKYILPIAIPVALLFSCSSFAKSAELLPIKPKIVGGEVATEGDWPWMSALVFTSNRISSSLNITGTTFESIAFTGSPAGSVMGPIIDCGLGDKPCEQATASVCLIERGDIDFSLKATNCEAGGGIGVIIFNNVDGDVNGTLGDGFTGTIPVISVTQADGVILQNKIGEEATIEVAESVALAQTSTCGASFIGDKWVMTASHCVDGVIASQLKVNVGEYDLSNGAENAKTVKRIYMHPNYDAELIDNDIALIELTESIDNEAITIVDLAATEQFSIDNSTVTVMGWGGRVGYEAGGGPTSDFPDVLHQVDLQLLSNEQCKTTLANSFEDLYGEENIDPQTTGISDAMLCATVAGGGKGSCQGDSGGPLVINTNQGWQQIGIVSYGIGCAAEGFPGVYARPAVFIDWINEITQGVAIEQTHSFGISAQGSKQTAVVEVTNNSDVVANLTFAVDGDQSFTLATENCTTLLAGASCEIVVTYNADTIGEHKADVVITSDNNSLLVSKSVITGQSIGAAAEIATQLATNDEVLHWFSGGDLPWKANAADASIESGVITDSQESTVLVTLNGEGQLSFEWSVSSEENIDDPDAPFDALYLYVDDVLINFISGEVPFEVQNIDLLAGEHKITWVYKKDSGASEFDDKGYIRNVTFTPKVVVTPTTPVVTPPKNPNARSNGGGSLAWLSLLLLAVVNIRRQK